MTSSFRQAIKQTKVDSILGDKLLQDTERFFLHNKTLRKTLNKPKSSVKQSNTRTESHIYY